MPTLSTYEWNQSIELRVTHSMHFGRSFWLDENKDFCSAPDFDGMVTDFDRWEYVSEWISFDSSDLDKLYMIHRSLCSDLFS